MRTYIEWCRLLNRLTNMAFDSRSPKNFWYWQRHRTRLIHLLNSKGWRF